METLPYSPTARARSRVGAAIACAIALIALMVLPGCTATEAKPKVTVTVAPPEPSPTIEEPGTPGAPDPNEPEPEPDPVVTPTLPDPEPPPPPSTPDPLPPVDGVTLAVSQGAVSPGCTNSTCWYVHVEWEGLDPGWHRVQCVINRPDLGAWSEGNYNFPTASGGRDLGCFIAYPGSQVWVIVDGLYESPRADWG